MMELLKDLSDYGGIGLVAVVALVWAYRLYRDLKIAQGVHLQEMSALRENHRKQMDALRERYITKAETWMAKYHEMANAQTMMLEAFERRYGK